jgi:DNA-directed RNA polymerase specialized sigma24 family protein
VQETYSRWYAMSSDQQTAIASPPAWLTTVAARICLDVLGSARVRRETYVGEWVPEPLPEPGEWPGAAPADPADRVTLDDSVSMAFLVVLESMTPAERVAFILHDVFRYSFAEVGEIVGRSPAACRQLASSARRRIPPDAIAVRPEHQAGIVRDFKQAWQANDIGALLRLLDPEATVVADGGGVVSAALEPVQGAAVIADFLVGLNAYATAGTELLERTVNGQPGLVGVEDGVIATVYAFDIVGGRITNIWAIRNPGKLRPWL